MPDAVHPSPFNPHVARFLADPFPTYAQFRESDPIYPVALYQSDWLFRYADCQTVLTGTDVWLKNSPKGGSAPYGPYGMMGNFPQGLFSSDPPVHTTLRSILQPMFDEAIKCGPAPPRRSPEPLLAKAAQHGRLELITDYALPLPASVLFTLLGIPNDPGVWSGLITWQAAIAAAHDITQTPAVRGTGATCSMALNSFFEGMALANKATPAGG